MYDRTQVNDAEERADAIGRALPFSTWPRPVLLRLAAASALSSHPPGSVLITDGQVADALIVLVEGMVLSSVSSPEGRRVIFKFDDSHYAYGLTSLVDGLATPHDLVAAGRVTAIRIPHVAVRAELARTPLLWESIALEATRRGRHFNAQMQQFVFDPPLVRAATILMDLLAKDGKDRSTGSALIGLRLPQERLAELLGTSRQWATGLVRELTQAGLIEWRYGRVTVRDVPAMRALAARSIDATHSTPPPRSATVAGSDATHPLQAMPRARQPKQPRQPRGADGANALGGEGRS